jgi:TolB protein
MRGSRSATGVGALSLLAMLLAGAQAPSPPAPAKTPVPAGATAQPAAGAQAVASLLFPGEEHFLANVRQLTFAGENAEAYFDPPGERLIFQSTRDGAACDQIYTMRTDGSEATRVSTGRGRTTCGYFIPGRDRILFSSTHGASPDCPPRADMSKGYVWSVYAQYDIYAARPDGSGLAVLAASPGYDAEATASVDGGRIVFTSDRDGDLEIYSMAADGSDVRRLTRTPGYDGGPFYDRTGGRVVYRANHPEGTGLADYLELLGRHLVRPTTMEIWTMNADGSNARQVTRNGAANFAPYFTPDGKAIIFASNRDDPRGRNFDLWLVTADGARERRVTQSPVFEAFPMFSPDGRRLVFASNRNAATPGDTNIFIADWIWDGTF